MKKLITLFILITATLSSFGQASGIWSRVTASGTNTYTAPAPPGCTCASYCDGCRYQVIFTNANTSTPVTLAIHTAGAKTIYNSSGVALAVGEIKAIKETILIYSSALNGFRLINSGPEMSDLQNGPVTSVFGRTGDVIAQSGDYTKSDVELGNVDNTSDANKPVSTSQQTALDLKANLAGPTFTGTVTLPSTTSIGTVSSTEIGYVDAVTSALQPQLDAKQTTLVSGTNIKTINGSSVLGSGDLTVSGSASQTISKGTTTSSPSEDAVFNALSSLTAENIPLGTIYTKSSWSDLSDFTNNGSTVSVVSNALQFSGGSGSFTQTLDYNRFTCLENWKIVSRVKVGTKDGSSFGFGFGVRSTNSYGSYNLYGRFNMSSTGGECRLNGGSSNTLLATTSAALSFNVNDVIEIEVEKNGYVATVTARNITTASTDVSVNYSFITDGSNPTLPNTGRFVIGSYGGTFTVQSMTISSTVPKRAKILLVSDSKGVGYRTTAYNKRFASILNLNYPNVASVSGGSDRIIDVLTRVNEIIELKPHICLLAIGSNDKRSGVSDATTQTNYASLVSQITAAGIRVVHLLPFKETVLNQDNLKDFIIATYAADDIIDTYTPVISLDADGIHPNNTGNATIEYVSRTSGKLSFPSYSVTYTAKTSAYTFVNTDNTHIVEVTSGTHTQTLPTAVGITGHYYYVTNSGSGVVTVATTSSQTFVNVSGTPTTLTLNQFDKAILVSNGANWLRF